MHVLQVGVGSSNIQHAMATQDGFANICSGEFCPPPPEELWKSRLRLCARAHLTETAAFPTTAVDYSPAVIQQQREKHSSPQLTYHVSE